mmetsp:Transcript_97776/g.218203  ORF Transcript_97776/g.218203 Transcript_97776/m.218203 type:complete len:276 (-) Transcript_97776:61-888(-)
MRLIGPIIISRRSSCRSSRTRTQALRRASRSATLWHPTRRYGGRSHITALKASGQASSRQMPSSARIFMSVLQSLGGLWRRGRRVSISRTCSSLGTAMNSALGMQTALAWIWGVVWQWWSQLVLGAPTATCFPTKGRLLEQDFPTDWPIDNLMEETLVRKESFAENIHHLLMYYLAHDFDCRTLCPPILRQKRWEWPVGELRDNLKRNGFIHIQDDNAFWKGHHRLTKWTMELLAIPLVPVAIYITSRVYRRRLLRFGRWLVRRLWFSPLGGVDK